MGLSWTTKYELLLHSWIDSIQYVYHRVLTEFYINSDSDLDKKELNKENT